MTRAIAISAVVFAAALLLTPSVTAHITAVSPYTFHRDVVPILEARCGRCHGDGSASGVSLLRYDSARGASWLIRQQLVSSHMPPWFAAGDFKAHPALTARELNVLMTWATGGAPEGAAVARETRVALSWPLGPPDQMVSMPRAFTFSGDRSDQVYEVRLPDAKIGRRLIRAVDILAGTPALVRRAEIIAKSGKGEQMLGLWQPGEAPAVLEGNAAFRVPAGATLVLRMHYRRHYGDPPSDRSQVGLYFASRGAVPVDALELAGQAGRTSVHRIVKPVRAVAIRPIAGPSGARVRVVAVAADGLRTELAVIQIQRDWERRYVFATPVTLAAGGAIEILVIPSQGELWKSLTGEPTGPDAPVRLALETVK